MSALVVIFFAIFGVISFGFVIGSCANQKAKQVLATTPIAHIEKKSFTFNQYDFYTFNDLCSEDGLTNIIGFFSNSNGVDLLHDTSTHTYSQNVADNCYFVDALDLNPSNLTSSSVRYMYVSHITLETSGRIQNSSNNYSQRFIIRFFNSSMPTDYLAIYSYYVENASLGATRTWFTEGIYHGNTTNDVVYDYPSKLVLVAEYQDDYTLRSLLPYGATTNNGFKRGWDSGYQSGYTRGWNDCFHGEASDNNVSNDTYNVFSLLSSAFDSIASILSINIFSGLTLGTLLFTPLVVVLIIALFRIFRG